MERKNVNVPDAIHCGQTREYTTVPNALLRNPDVSLKAKGLLCILLSNKEGWKSHLKTLNRMTRDGLAGIRGALEELEELDYLRRIRYRNKATKQWAGSFWAYTDVPGQFDVIQNSELLEGMGFEPEVEKPPMEKPRVANRTLKRLRDKKTKEKKPNLFSRKLIQPSQFEKFWRLYPKKIDRGKCEKRWGEICNRQTNVPTWEEVRRAVRDQRQSERWQDPKFIPYPYTWLNQMRWKDDAAEMKGWESDAAETKLMRAEDQFDEGYAKKFLRYVEEARGIVSGDPVLVEGKMVELFVWVRGNQKSGFSEMNPPGTIVRDYVNWLGNQTWLNLPSHNCNTLFDPEGGIFQRFLKEVSREEGRDVLTGRRVK